MNEPSPKDIDYGKPASEEEVRTALKLMHGALDQITDLFTAELIR